MLQFKRLCKNLSVLSPAYKFPDVDEATEHERLQQLQALVGHIPDYIKGHVSDIVRPVTALLCELLDTPKAVADLLDDEYLHLFGGHNYDVKHIPSLDSVCCWHLIPNKPEMLIVKNAHKDGRFKRAPAVVNKLVFVVGSPLVTDDAVVLGSLCVFDEKPRKFDASGAALLSNFTDVVAESLEFVRVGKDKHNRGVILCDTRHDDWPILYLNDKFESYFGDALDHKVWTLFKPYTTHAIPDVSVIADFTITVMALGHASKSVTLYTAHFWRADIAPITRKITHCSKQQVYDFSHLYFARFEAHEHYSSPDACRLDVELSLECPIPGLKLHSLIGRGGFGCVFKATLKKKHVAVKLMASNPDGSRPLETVITSYGEHKNILRIYDCVVVQCKQAYQCWVVTELCDNGTLMRWIDQGMFRTTASFYEGGPILDTILQTALQIAEGLQSLHDHGIIHADLNCNNILVTSDFTYKLADFGLSKMTMSVPLKSLQGTVSHMPIELLRDKTLTPAVDIYSFGVVLYELYTSRRAWAGKRYMSIIASKLIGEQLQFPTDAPPQLRNLVTGCLNDEYQKRPVIADVILELRAMIADHTLSVQSDRPVYA